MFLHQLSKDDQTTWTWGGSQRLCRTVRVLLSLLLHFLLAFYPYHQVQTKEKISWANRVQFINIWWFDRILPRDLTYVSVRFEDTAARSLIQRWECVYHEMLSLCLHTVAEDDSLHIRPLLTEIPVHSYGHLARSCLSLRSLAEETKSVLCCKFMSNKFMMPKTARATSTF